MCLNCVPGILAALFAITGPASATDDARDLNVLVKMGFADARQMGPLRHGRSVVIRSAQELAANSDPKRANDPAFQEEVEAQLAKFLKMDVIDWNKQMVVAVWATVPPQRSPLPPVAFVSFRIHAGQLKVSWTLQGEGCCYPSPRGVALVERFDGPVQFNPPEK